MALQIDPEANFYCNDYMVFGVEVLCGKSHTGIGSVKVRRDSDHQSKGKDYRPARVSMELCSYWSKPSFLYSLLRAWAT